MSTRFNELEALPPGQITGKEFEKIISDHAGRLENREILMLARYGTVASFFGGKLTAKDSLPDFEGVTSMGVQLIIEAKVTSSDRLSLAPHIVRPRQIKHMAKRARFNVPCFILCHHTGREMATKTVPPVTKVYPVHPSLPWVKECLEAYEKKQKTKGSIPHDMGFEIPWQQFQNCKNAGPNLMIALEKTRGIIYNLNAEAMQ